MTNPARDLAATGTPGPWETWKMADEGPSKWTMHGVAVPDDEMGHRGEFMFADDAEKAARAVNALPAIADLLDAIDDEPFYDDPVVEWQVYHRQVAAAGDAVAAALTGETP